MLPADIATPAPEVVDRCKALLNAITRDAMQAHPGHLRRQCLAPPPARLGVNRSTLYRRLLNN